MELIVINKNNENSFDPTPKLNSSPVPILFIPFNWNEDKCNYCGNKYSETLQFEQKYCKNCLFWYIKYITDDNTYLDVKIVTKNTQCIEHEATRNPRNIREWCEHCSEILYFNQIIYNSNYPNIYILNDCSLCGKIIYQQIGTYDEFKLCSDCYLISSGWVESTLAKKPIPILYLPWWDTTYNCNKCRNKLILVSDCQKWCSDCYLIYTGCRYCLTTNIILGPTNQSQCRKCKRISIIDINFTIISSGDHNIDEILYYINFDNQFNQFDQQIANYMNNVYKNDCCPSELYNIVGKFILGPKMKWIPYSQIENLKEIAKGGFGIIYKATLSNETFTETVALKKFFNSQNMSKYFLNELKSLYQCYNDYIIKYIGITQDPKTKEFMLIMDYANGDLHNYLQIDFANITWEKKLNILSGILEGLKSIHDNNFIHRDFHSGNILSIVSEYYGWKICDFGLSQPANTLSNNEIYGVIPYIAPEIFKGAAFSKESDIYSFGMIMWELTTGCKPFANIDHDTVLIYKIIDGKRPEITSDTPEFFANLMKRCWDSDPLKRPSTLEIKSIVNTWYLCLSKSLGNFEKQFKQAEEKRIELIQSKKLGPEFSEKPHPKAIFTSRPLSSLISKSSYSSSIIKFNAEQEYTEYITKEHELDINNIQSLPLKNINSIQNSLTTRPSNAIYTSRPLSKLISNVNFSRKRNIEEITQNNNRKHIKTDDGFSLNSESHY